MLSLRTIKSDVVCGIPEGKAEELDKEEPGWKISGTHAILESIATHLLTRIMRTRRQVRRRPALRRPQGRAGRVLSKGAGTSAREGVILYTTDL